MKKITELTAELAAPAIAEQGCTLWDVEYVKEAGTWYLRILLDKEGGVDSVQEAMSPAQKQHTDVTAAHTTTPRKLLNSRMAVSAGKITREEISMAPIIRIPSTMVRAVRMASRVLYQSTRSPVAREKLSSNVTAKSLW